jgi:TolB protein
MAIGATRVYVKPEGKLSAGSYLEALAAGRSFVSNGPMLEFTVAGAGPGNAITNGESQVAWSLDVHSALPFDSVQIIVNGAVVQTLDGNSEAGSKRFEDVVTAPDGGWITARVLGDAVRWPAMDSYLFAETSPVWFGTVGSSDAATRRQSAQKLLTVLDDAEQRLKSGYGNAPIPKLLEHFGKARVRLEELANQ